MRISKGTNNTIKKGRTWLWLKKDKVICFEWSLRPLNPLNLYLELDGGEGYYTLCFWFIWVFYIKFSGIFKYYPKEWNSFANNKKGGYLASATRKIGISQYNDAISIDIWHDGNGCSWYSDKDTKIYHKTIWLVDIFCGRWQYHTIEESDTKEYLDLPEKRYEVDVQYRFWHKKWKRFYMKFFNHKGKSILIKSDIKYPNRKYEENDKEYGTRPEDLENRMSDKGEWVSLKPEQTINDAIKLYRDIIIEKRSVESKDWVPSEYRKQYQREKKLERLCK